MRDLDILQVGFYFMMQLLITVGLHFVWYLSDISAEQENSIQKETYAKKSKYLLIGLYVFYILISVFRSTAQNFGGIDAYFYWDYYNKAGGTFIEYSKINTMELGFRLLTWLFKNFGIPFRVLLFVVHTVMFVAVSAFCKYCRKQKAGFTGYLATFLLVGELFVAFCIVRNEMALAFSLIFFILMDKKEYKKALIPMLLALSVHLSSLILFVVYILLIVLDRSCAKGKKNVFLWLGAFFLAELWIIPLIDFVVLHTKYAYYIGGGGLAVGTYAMLAVMTLAILIDEKNELIESTLGRYLLVAWTCLPLQLSYGILYRTLLFFMPIVFIMIPSVWSSLGDFPLQFDKNLKKFKFDKTVFPKITRDNYYDFGIYIPLLRVGLKLVILVYTFSRIYKLFTADYISYGLYPYLPYFVN